MRFLKKVLFLLVVSIICLLYAGMATASANSENQNDPLGIDLMVVLDNRWSMKNGDDASDFNGYRFDAVASVMNMLDTKQSKANFFMFNDSSFLYVDGRRVDINDKNKPTLSDVSMTLGLHSRPIITWFRHKVSAG